MATINYNSGSLILLAEHIPEIGCPARFYFNYEFLGLNSDGSSRVRTGVYWDSEVKITQRKMSGDWYPVIGIRRPGTNYSRGFTATINFTYHWGEIAVPKTFSLNDNIFLLGYEVIGEEYQDEVGYTCRDVKATYREWGYQSEDNYKNNIICAGEITIKENPLNVGIPDIYTYTIEQVELKFSDLMVITLTRDTFYDNQAISFILDNPNKNLTEAYVELVQADDRSKVIIPRKDIATNFSSMECSIDLTVPPDNNVAPALYEYMYDKTEAEAYIQVHYRARNAANFTTSSAKIIIVLEEIGQSDEYARLRPILNYSAKDINPTTKALTGNDSYFIRYFSNVEATLSVDGVKGAKIVSQAIRTSEAVVGTDYYLFENIAASTISFYATDSRGYSNNISLNQQFLLYVKPTVNITGIGLPQVDDTCQVITSGRYWDNSFGRVHNKLTFYYRYKSTSIPEYVDWIKVNNPDIEMNWDEYSYNAQFNVNLPNHVDSFTIQIMAKDELTSSESGTRTVRAYPLFDWGEYDFHFNIPVNIDGDLHVNGVITSNTPEAQQIEPADYIIEQGTRQTGSGNSLANWTFRKWNSGMYECWCRKHIQTSVSTAWGNMFVSGALPHTNLIWPGAFIDIPVANITIAPNASGAFLIAGGSTNLTATNTGGYEIARGTSLSSGNFYINYYGMGRWK